MRWFRQRRTARFAAEERAVVTAIRMLRPSHAFGLPIMRLSRLSPGRAYVVLGRLERSGRVTSNWADVSGPVRPAYPRRRLYRLANGVDR